MEPISTLAAVCIRWGASKVTKALLGKDAGELANELVGAVQQMEQSSLRVLEIERKLDFLVDQRFRASSGAGARYLSQALLSGRSAADRASDLALADAALVDATYSASSALQRACSERLLLLVRMSRGDTSGTQHTYEYFDVCVGEASSERESRYADIGSRVNRLLETGKYGPPSLKSRFWSPATPDDRRKAAFGEIEALQGAASRQIEGLFADNLALAELVGAPSRPALSTLKGTTVRGSGPTPLRCGGVEAQITGVEEGVNGPWERSNVPFTVVTGRVALSSSRGRAENALLVCGNAEMQLSTRHGAGAQSITIAPGQSRSLSAHVWPQSGELVGIACGGVTMLFNGILQS